MKKLSLTAETSGTETENIRAEKVPSLFFFRKTVGVRNVFTPTPGRFHREPALSCFEFTKKGIILR